MNSKNTVKAYLHAMENRNLDQAACYLAAGFTMTFPGGVTFRQPAELAEWAKTRYIHIAKSYQRFDECRGDGEVVIYCYGTLNGAWLDGSNFADIRFIDRFVLVDGLITSQLVWNDLAEVGVLKAKG